MDRGTLEVRVARGRLEEDPRQRDGADRLPIARRAGVLTRGRLRAREGDVARRRRRLFAPDELHRPASAREGDAGEGSVGSMKRDRPPIRTDLPGDEHPVAVGPRPETRRRSGPRRRRRAQLRLTRSRAEESLGEGDGRERRPLGLEAGRCGAPRGAATVEPQIPAVCSRLTTPDEARVSPVQRVGVARHDAVASNDGPELRPDALRHERPAPIGRRLNCRRGPRPSGPDQKSERRPPHHARSRHGRDIARAARPSHRLSTEPRLSRLPQSHASFALRAVGFFMPRGGPGFTRLGVRLDEPAVRRIRRTPLLEPGRFG